MQNLETTSTMTETVNYDDLDLSLSQFLNTEISCLEHNLLIRDMSTEEKEILNDTMRSSFQESAFSFPNMHVLDQNISNMSKKETLGLETTKVLQYDDSTLSEYNKLNATLTSHSSIEIQCSPMMFTKENNKSSFKTEPYGILGCTDFQNTYISSSIEKKISSLPEKKCSQNSIPEKFSDIQGNVAHKISIYKANIIQEDPSNEIMNVSREEISGSRILNVLSQKCSKDLLNISSHAISNNRKRIFSSQESSVNDAIISSSQENSSNQKINIFCQDCEKMLISSQESLSDEKMLTSSQKSFGNEKMLISSQESLSDEKMLTSSQESFRDEKMLTSSQESFSDEKMLTSSQKSFSNEKMLTLNQESFSGEKKFTSSQGSYSDEKMLTSSQESFGNEKMFISGQESLSDEKMFTSSQESTSCQSMITSNQEIHGSQRIFASCQKCLHEITAKKHCNREGANSQRRGNSNHRSRDKTNLIEYLCFKRKSKRMKTEKLTASIDALPETNYNKMCDKTVRSKRIQRKLKLKKRKSFEEKWKRLFTAQETGILKRTKTLKAKRTQNI